MIGTTTETKFTNKLLLRYWKVGNLRQTFPDQSSADTE